jgi:two-component system LytT family sensor kinase
MNRIVRQPLLRQALRIFGAWIAIGIFFGWQHHTQVLANDGQDDLTQRLVRVISSMIVWALLTPVVLFVADRLPLRAPHRTRNALLLLPVCSAIAVIRSSIDALLPLPLEGLEMMPFEHHSYLLSTLHTHSLFVVLIVGIANYGRMQREIAAAGRVEARSQAELATARLRRLRADLDPHFLFNALNAVAALVHTDASRAEQMLAAVTDLLRHSVDSHEALEVRVAQELSFVERYLDVQKTRFGDRLAWNIEIRDPRLADAAVPPLLLQSLVENAINHGLSKRSDQGVIEVRVGMRSEHLCLEVADNGPGSGPEALFAGKGVGIANAKARLELAYGGDCSLDFRYEADRFIARVLIPLQTFFPETLAS